MPTETPVLEKPYINVVTPDGQPHVLEGSKWTHTTWKEDDVWGVDVEKDGVRLTFYRPMIVEVVDAD